MKTIYRLINRQDNTVKQYRDREAHALFLTGRRLSNYIVIRSGPRAGRYEDTVLNLVGDALNEYGDILIQL